ncbi:AfsR/SARP family transcriptional regulator [Kitasatospora sp. DSM 101779]|uniref:AfsR/SARP family transcriptional regulator n=1 Tax=Kitasatospora sp. DSM 101779 TaxID=2853165 RepID=UPI0021DA24F4|nr:BTAD domain-containing putative transcriptional regulator [Kitasatospora sp. DSM 101779]MCU7820996.1 tetratricopeptide repeat protein [Kitasatospora sp. DSM 101779]
MLLGTVALRANAATTADLLTEALWRGAPPRSAAANLRQYAADLRRLLAGDAPHAPALQSAAGTYTLTAGPDGLDSLAFAALAEEGRRALAEGRNDTAADRLTRALGLWRGPVLAGLPVPAVVQEEARVLEDGRIGVLEDHVEARLALGRHADLVGELTVLVKEHALRERLWRQLILALYRCGRQHDALDAYRRLHGLLDEELGVRPASPSRELHRRILCGDPALDLPRTGGGAGLPTAPRAPWQLPPRQQPFVGRGTELTALSTIMAELTPDPGPAVLALLTGPAGVGKSALALHWAHLARRRFPDGCLYVDLRGYGPDRPRRPDEVLTEFLRTLGTEVPAVGDGETELLAGRFRTAVTGRRILVVLDNAHRAEQVRPLLPGDSCGVLVTSRESLSGLVARDGARRVALDLLPLDDAVRLLGELLGERDDADPGTLAPLAEHCARLPLALRIAAELAASRSGATLTELTAELADERRRLDLLGTGHDPFTDLRPVLSWSNRHLPPRAARAFRLLGLHPGRHVDHHAVAALTRSSLPDARRILDELLRAHLVHLIGPDRHTSHDLLRDYARELTTRHDSPAERNAALERLLDQSAHSLAAATAVLYPYESDRREQVRAPAVPGPLPDRPDRARNWLDAQTANLLALADTAREGGWHDRLAALSALLHRHLHVTGRYAEAHALHGLALDGARTDRDRAAALLHLGITEYRLARYPEAMARLTAAHELAVRLGDRASEGAALHGLAQVHERLGRMPETFDHHRRALEIRRALGDRVGEGTSLGNLGLVHERLGRYTEALDHYRRALAIHRATGFRSAEGDMLNNIAIVHRQSGRLEEAAASLADALRIYEEIGDRGGAGAALNNLGLVGINRRDWRAAGQHLERALEVHRAIRSPAPRPRPSTSSACCTTSRGAMPGARPTSGRP